MSRDWKALFNFSNDEQWLERGMNSLAAVFSFAAMHTQSDKRVAVAAVIEVERSKAELAKLSVEAQEFFGVSNAKRLVLASAIGTALHVILCDLHKAVSLGAKSGKETRQSTQFMLVEFQAEFESYAALLFETLASYPGPESRSDLAAAALQKTATQLVAAMAAILCEIEMDESVPYGSDRVFSHLSNVSRIAIIGREFFADGDESLKVTEEIMQSLGII